jgi:hypothetical protein
MGVWPVQVSGPGAAVRIDTLQPSDRSSIWLVGRRKTPTPALAGMGLTVPQGVSDEQFARLSHGVREIAGGYGSDIAVHGSRAAGTATAVSDIDIAIRVTPEEFGRIPDARFGTPTPVSAKVPRSARSRALTNGV